MIRRPAVTLIEVLVSMFIMAIGMLALLVLFPLGAISMAQALRDDRCASTASMAENVAIATNLRHDTTVIGTFDGPPVRQVVYVDPNGVIGLSLPAKSSVGGGGVIPRVTPSFIGSQLLADRWFSLPDDIKFNESGTSDTFTTGGSVDRGRRYSFAYLLTRPPLNPPPLQQTQERLVNLTVVVYAGRPVGALSAEPTFAAPLTPVLGTAGTNAVVIQNVLTSQLTLKIGGWILDTSGYFYRVTNITDNGANATVLEVTPNLKADVAAVMVMEYVAEVFDKGTSWQP